MALEQCAKWLHGNDGILWVEHVWFGRRLSEISNVPYFGAKGLADSGRFIEDHKPGTAMIAGIESNHRGRNLQAWSSNFIAAPPPNGERWEQLLGRTHRPGQTADEVRADYAAFVREHVAAYEQAVADCAYVLSTVGEEQKLGLADYDGVTMQEIEQRVGPRWS